MDTSDTMKERSITSTDQTEVEGLLVDCFWSKELVCKWMEAKCLTPETSKFRRLVPNHSALQNFHLWLDSTKPNAKDLSQRVWLVVWRKVDSCLRIYM